MADSITLGRTYDANQSEVCSGVREYLAGTGAPSSTTAYEDARAKLAATC